MYFVLQQLKKVSVHKYCDKAYELCVAVFETFCLIQQALIQIISRTWRNDDNTCNLFDLLAHAYSLLFLCYTSQVLYFLSIPGHIFSYEVRFRTIYPKYQQYAEDGYDVGGVWGGKDDTLVREAFRKIIRLKLGFCPKRLDPRPPPGTLGFPKKEGKKMNAQWS